MRKTILASLSALALLAAAASLDTRPAIAADWLETAAAPLKGTEISVIFLDRPGYRAIIKLLPEFEKKTGIKVNYEIVPYENTREKEVLNFTSGGDLTMALVDLVWIGEFAENGWIEPIEKFQSDASITDPNLKSEGFFPLLLDAFGSWGGKVYGLPFDNYSGLLFYNSCKLKDAGFDKPPETWADLKDVYGPKLTDPSKNQYAFALQSLRGETQSADSFMRMLWPFGGSLLNKEFKSNLLSPESQAGLKFRQDLMKYMPPGIVSFDDYRVVGFLWDLNRSGHIQTWRLPCGGPRTRRPRWPPSSTWRLLAGGCVPGERGTEKSLLALHPVGDLGRNRASLCGSRRRFRPDVDL
jgi:multiple sugar transport system substrate-binding protein